jgi:hypothetical protein
MRERTKLWTVATLLLLSMVAIVSGCRALRLAPTATPTEEVELTAITTPTEAPSLTDEPTATTVPPTATPTIAIAPRSGPPGTSVTVQAEGFAPESNLAIGFGRVDSEYDVLQSVQADASGSVTAEVRVPAFAEPDDAWVFVVANVRTDTKAISDTFDVTGMPVPTETPTTGGFTGANIYLIAIDDGGVSGKLIGCNDSVVPVEITFEPTIAPLGAALDKLLALDRQTHDATGLYNALGESDLNVAGINIVQGKATIALTGSLVLGGVCDTPRVAAQIRETALQFSTVRSVDVTLNGQPLESILSEE